MLENSRSRLSLAWSQLVLRIGSRSDTFLLVSFPPSVGVTRRLEDCWYSACHIQIFSRDGTSGLPSVSAASPCLEWWGNAAPSIGACSDETCVIFPLEGGMGGRK